MAIVCHCVAVRERTIVKAVRRGCADLESVGTACGAATRCGGCAPSVSRLIAEHAPEASGHHRPAIALA